jgi:hypothetical protein
MGFILDMVRTRLARFEFEALFGVDLDWSVEPREAPPIPLPEGTRLLAHCPLLDSPAMLLELMAEPGCPVAEGIDRLHRVARAVEGLVLWRSGPRSLWSWASGPPEDRHCHTRVVIQGSAPHRWAVRLASLHRDRLANRTALAPLLVSTESNPDRLLVQGFSQSWQALIEALPGGKAHPRTYAILILTRLIALVALQQRGYLGGDEWYLHNQFGQSQQRGPDQFFHQVLQPLTQQGFTLPPEERSPAFQQRFGPLPFVPTGPFRWHSLDQHWGGFPLPDAAFEPALHWLADLLEATAGEGVNPGLGVLLEQMVNAQEGLPLVTPPPLLEALNDRTVCAAVIDRAKTITGDRYGSVEQVLLALTPAQAAQVLTAVGDLTLLDPACGSGRLLVAALEQLLDLAQALQAIAAQASTKPLPPWAQPHPQGSALGLYRHLASHTLYGLDLWAPAIELARLRLWLVGVEQTTTPVELATLPDLSLNLIQGNALVGLIRVEDERFDQVAPRRGGKEGEAEALQGNLLQPLMADSYQAVLAERQVRLEHYRSQTQLLAEVGSVPAYAQADFLRDRLDELNAIAQEKLTHLLWREGSQQLGLRVPDPAHPRPTRPLSPADVEAAQPFHWGFYFHQRLVEQGGFDLVLSHFPHGAIEATQTGFVERYAALFKQKNVAPSTFLHNHQPVLTIDPDLARAWVEYRAQFAWLSQYLRRSDSYTHSSRGTDGQGQGRLYWSRLFLERSLQLLRPGGRCGVLLDPFWARGNSASLRHWLQRHSDVAAVVDLSNHRGLWPEAPARTTLCALWLQHQGPTQGSPYSAFTKNKALAPEHLTAAIARLS